MPATLRRLRGTPDTIRDQLQKASVKALQDEKVRMILASQAAIAVGNTSDEFRDFIRLEAARYAKIVAVTHLQLQ